MTHSYTHDAAEIRVLKLSGYRQFPLEYTLEKTLIITYNVSCSALLMKTALKMQARWMDWKSTHCGEKADLSPHPQWWAKMQSQRVRLMLAFKGRRLYNAVLGQLGAKGERKLGCF